MARRRVPLERRSRQTATSPAKMATSPAKITDSRSDGRQGRSGSKGTGDVTQLIGMVLLSSLVVGVAAYYFYPDISALVTRWHGQVSQDVGDADISGSGSLPGGQNLMSQSDQTEDGVHEPRGSLPSEPLGDGKQTPGPDHVTRRTRGDLMEGEEDPETQGRLEAGGQAEVLQLEADGNPSELQMLDEVTDDVPPQLTPRSDSKHKTPDENAESAEEVDATPGRRMEGDNEAILLDGTQPVTFTRVTSGQDGTLRLEVPQARARPDEAVVSSSSEKKGRDLPHESRDSGHEVDPGLRDASEGKTEHDSSRKDTNRTNINASASKGKTPSKAKKKKQTNKKKSVTLKPSGGHAADQEFEDDVPEEVRNFKPTYLKTVTAKKIFADGRRIPPIELLPQKETNSSVRVFLFDEFLSEEECDGLRSAHDKHVQDMASQEPILCFDSISTLRKHLKEVKKRVQVSPNDFVKGTRCTNATFSRQLGEWLGGNWSYSTAFYPGESRFSSIFASRVNRAMGLTPENGGKFQITSYATGKAYKEHTDCVLGGTDLRDRVASVLVYLNDVKDGGETRFPELGIWVKPKKGRALVWNNMSPDGMCEPHSRHVASKVNEGTKYVLIRWYYYQSFFSLGKRPPPPSLPARAEGQGRVSCDDYDNGSCRWYDEWNSDHLLDYKQYTRI